MLAPGSESLGKAERKSGEVSVLAPRLLRSFPGTFLIDCYLSPAFPSVSSRSEGLKVLLQVPSFLAKIFSFQLLMKAVS